MTTKRLFVALELPDIVRQQIASVCQILQRQQLFQGRCVAVEHLHLTFKFLGTIDVTRLDEVCNLLSQLRCSPFLVKTGNLGVFQSEHLIKILYLTLESQYLTDLAQAIDTILEPVVSKEPRPFVPHVTLARIKHVHDKDALLQAVERYTMEPVAFTATEFVLQESLLTPEGPIYLTVTRYPLA